MVDWLHLCVCVCVCARTCVCVLVAQSCLTLCDPMDCRPPGFCVHGILQARILEWIAIPFPKSKHLKGPNKADVGRGIRPQRHHIAPL